MDHALSAKRHEVADALFRRHMDQVETEVEVMIGLLTGARQALDRAGDSTPAATGYRRWELALQRLEAAYLHTAKLIGHLGNSPEWQGIEAIWSKLSELVQHWRDETIRLGTSFAQRWGERMKSTVVAAAETIGDLALQLAGRPDPERSVNAHDAVAALASTAHSVAGRPPHAPLPGREDSLSLSNEQLIAAWNASYETGRRFTSGRFDGSHVWELREGDQRFFIDPDRVPSELASLITDGDHFDPDGVTVTSIAVAKWRKPKAHGPAQDPAGTENAITPRSQNITPEAKLRMELSTLARQVTRHAPPPSPPPVSPPPRRAVGR